MIATPPTISLKRIFNFCKKNTWEKYVLFRLDPFKF